ncbi:MAG: PaaI family thioesterase [Candidatus Saccharicenans sp.]|uniref:PaaI family thioesterase n=1 Tax=Candidatus Saccharicenans sp. TaxID=2819258 RepID=UPI00404AEC76
MTERIINYPGCFICGEDNPSGLKLDFFFDRENRRAWAEFMPGREHEGYRNLLHGGIISSLLDEVMAKAILAGEIPVVTSRLTVEFKKPALIGEKLRLEGWITGHKSRAYFTAGHLLGSDGLVVAEANGVYIRAEGELIELLSQSLPEK